MVIVLFRIKISVLKTSVFKNIMTDYHFYANIFLNENKTQSVF